MTAGIYGFLGAIIAMVGVSTGLLGRMTHKLDRLEKLLEQKCENKS